MTYEEARAHAVTLGYDAIVFRGCRQPLKSVSARTLHQHGDVLEWRVSAWDPEPNGHRSGIKIPCIEFMVTVDWLSETGEARVTRRVVGMFNLSRVNGADPEEQRMRALAAKERAVLGLSVDDAEADAWWKAGTVT